MTLTERVRRYWDSTWPPRFLLVVVLAFLLRAVQALFGWRPLDLTEFLNVPVAAIVGLALWAFFRDPVVPLPRGDSFKRPHEH